MIKNEMQVRFSAITQNESFARMVAAAFATQLDPTIEQLADIRTAVSEAVTNAIIHGYRGMEGIVEMRCEVLGSRFFVAISDNGHGIEDIEMAMQPFYTSTSGLERSGMGFSVMEAFMDSVSVHSAKGAGTTVSMYKDILSVG